MFQVTVFTPSYNRAHTLTRLYESLKSQTNNNFEWLVVNDGSIDNTDELFDTWKEEDNTFTINYHKIKFNAGKNRAINKGVKLAQGKYFFIVDSDDWLQPDAIQFVIDSFERLPQDESFIGISLIRGNMEGKELNGAAKMDRTIGYVDCNNLQREKFNLQADMAEVFYTDKLKQYHFPVWEGEKFTPEAVIWDRMALDGYKLRWFNKVLYLCEYQQGGLSDSSWRLLRDNPMGYAMLFNIRLEYAKGVKQIVNYTLQYISCCFLGNEPSMIPRCVMPILAVILSPLGWLLSVRRKKQFKIYCDK